MTWDKAAIAEALSVMDLEYAVVEAVGALAARTNDDHAAAVTVALLRARMEVDQGRDVP